MPESSIGAPASPSTTSMSYVVCHECGFSAGPLDVSLSLATLRDAVGEWRKLFSSPESISTCRVHTGLSGWSPLERAVQVRDVLHVKAIRLERLRDSDAPLLDETSLDVPRGGDVDPQAVIATMRANSERLAGVVRAMPESSWRNEGRRAGVAITAHMILDEAVHCAVHDLSDVRDGLRVAAGSSVRVAAPTEPIES